MSIYGDPNVHILQKRYSSVDLARYRRVSIPFDLSVESLIGSHFLQLMSACVSVLLVICVHADTSSLACQREEYGE